MSVNIKFTRVIALAFFVGALPFLFSARTYAQESISDATLQERTAAPTTENKWLDDYKAPVGLTYGVSARFQTAYIWRGLYCGALNTQIDANVGYGGLYFDMWWHLGTADWSFKQFQPEVDFSIGFARWGLDISVLYIYNFNCDFFDFGAYTDKGNRLDLLARYTVSSKLPLSFLWMTRIAAADHYIDAEGKMVRAYSSYAEISYTHHFPYDISLFGAFGITPWRSMYTGYQRGFAVQNIELRLRKDWTVAERCGLMVEGKLSINPSALAADKTTAEWHPLSPENQSINANIALGIYLK